MTESSDENKDKSTQKNEKHSDEPSSTSTSANAPIKTILTNVNRGNQQANKNDLVVTNKAETNILKIQVPFSLENEISKIKLSIPLTELVTQDIYI